MEQHPIVMNGKRLIEVNGKSRWVTELDTAYGDLGSANEKAARAVFQRAPRSTLEFRLDSIRRALDRVSELGGDLSHSTVWGAVRIVKQLETQL